MCANPNERMPGVSITQPEPERRQRQRDRLGRGVPPPAHVGDLADGPFRLGHKAIHQRRLADAGMSEQHRDLAVEQVGHRQQRIVDARGDHRQVQVERTARRTAPAGRGRSWSGTGSASARRHRPRSAPGRPARCAAAGRPAPPRSAIGRRWRPPLVRSDRCHRPCAATPFAVSPRRTMRASVSVASGQIADHVDVVTDHDRGAAQFPGPHGRDPAIGVSAQHASPAAAVDADHHRGFGVGVLGTSLGARSRAPAGADLDVGLVVIAGLQPVDSSIRAHSCGNSGSVLAVEPMSSTSTPATRSPTIAPAIAIRWSA